MEKKRSLRILAASDIHGDSKVTKKLVAMAVKENADLIVLCGDLTGLVETKDIIKPFKDKGFKVLILPGNWDSFATTDFLARLYDVRNIHGYSAIYNNVGFFGAGGADIGPDLVTERELMKTLEKAHTGIKGIEKKVMLTHMHPAGTKSEFSGIEGSNSIRNAVKKFKPDLLLHGHIHEASGFEDRIGRTKVINVGKEGVIVEI